MSFDSIAWIGTGGNDTIFTIFILAVFGIPTLIIMYLMAIVAYGAYDKLLPKKYKKKLSEQEFIIILVILGTALVWFLIASL